MFPHHQINGAVRLPQPRRGTGNGTLARHDADGRRDGKQSADKDVAPKAQRRQSKRKRGRRSHGKEKGKSAGGSARRLRTLKERSGKECVRKKLPLNCVLSGPTLRQRSSPTGRDGEGGSVQQIREDGIAK